jgi:hypothetical protein
LEEVVNSDSAEMEGGVADVDSKQLLEEPGAALKDVEDLVAEARVAVH